MLITDKQAQKIAEHYKKKYTWAKGNQTIVYWPNIKENNEDQEAIKSIINSDSPDITKKHNVWDETNS